MPHKADAAACTLAQADAVASRTPMPSGVLIKSLMNPGASVIIL